MIEKLTNELEEIAYFMDGHLMVKDAATVREAIRLLKSQESRIAVIAPRLEELRSVVNKVIARATAQVAACLHATPAGGSTPPSLVATSTSQV